MRIAADDALAGEPGSVARAARHLGGIVPDGWEWKPVAAEIQCTGKYPLTHREELIQLRRPLLEWRT